MAQPFYLFSNAEAGEYFGNDLLSKLTSVYLAKQGQGVFHLYATKVERNIGAKILKRRGKRRRG